jgi:hypothetical protein
MDDTRTIRAVLVGVGKPLYWPVNEDLGSGAQQDVEDLGQLLRRKFGAEVVSLVGPRATKEAVMRAVTETLAEGCREGDIAVFYFGGHGIRKSVDDVAFAVYDTVWLTRGNRNNESYRKTVLTIDELRSAFQGLTSGVRIEAIFDTCFAGRATHGWAKLVRGVPGPLRRFRATTNPYALPNVVVQALKEREFVLWLSSAGNAQSFQKSDSVGRMRGAFTLDFLSAMRYTKPEVPREARMELIKAKLARGNHPQKPELRASPDWLRQRPVFTFDASS